MAYVSMTKQLVLGSRHWGLLLSMEVLVFGMKASVLGTAVVALGTGVL